MTSPERLAEAIGASRVSCSMPDWASEPICDVYYDQRLTLHSCGLLDDSRGVDSCRVADVAIDLPGLRFDDISRRLARRYPDLRIGLLVADDGRAHEVVTPRVAGPTASSIAVASLPGVDLATIDPGRASELLLGGSEPGLVEIYSDGAVAQVGDLLVWSGPRVDRAELAAAVDALTPA